MVAAIRPLCGQNFSSTFQHSIFHGIAVIGQKSSKMVKTRKGRPKVTNHSSFCLVSIGPIECGKCHLNSFLSPKRCPGLVIIYSLKFQHWIPLASFKVYIWVIILWKSMLLITSHINLQEILLHNARLSSVPATIDRLQKLLALELSYNNLFYLPTDMLKLTNLRYLYLRNNLFSSADIQTFQTQVNNFLPKITLIA
jgi:hypothetical protein